MPTDAEELRLRLTVMQNALLMMQAKHPDRRELSDVSKEILEKYKEYLLGEFVLNLTVIQDPVATGAHV